MVTATARAFVRSPTAFPRRGALSVRRAAPVQAPSTRRSSSQAAQLRKVREFAEDALRVARETGPRAAAYRTFEAQRAILATVVEMADELPRPPPPSLAFQMATEFVDAARAPSTGGGPRIPPVVSEWLAANARPELAARFVRKLFERLGATYVKIGQFIASSPTLFPPAYVKEFESCLDATPPVGFEAIRSIVEADLGRPLLEVFDSFEQTPLASASVAQVHAAVYRGRDVVVKVRKPGVDELLRADLGFIEVAGKALELIAPDLSRISLADVLADLRATMLDELDFAKELRNLETFGAWLDGSPGLRDVATGPEPFADASGPRTLTMTRLRGVPLTELTTTGTTTNPGAERTLVNALNVWTASVLTCDFFHADVHAGNVLALDDGRVGFVDFGIVGRVPAEIWDAVARAAAAAADRDVDALARALRDMGAADKEVDLVRFAADLDGVFRALDAIEPTVTVAESPSAASLSAAVTLDDQQVTDVLINLVTAADQNGVKLPREFGLLVKQALYFDRFVKLLAPDMDVLNDDRLEYLKDATDRAGGDDSAARRPSSLPPP